MMLLLHQIVFYDLDAKFRKNIKLFIIDIYLFSYLFIYLFLLFYRKQLTIRLEIKNYNTILIEK